MSIEEKAAQMVTTAQVITLASIDENGYLCPETMLKVNLLENKSTK